MTKVVTSNGDSVKLHKLLQDCLDKKITQKQCGVLLGLSDRQIRRKCKVLSSSGVSGLEHGSIGKCPVNRIAEVTCTHVLECCNTNFVDYGPTLVSY